MLPAGHRLTRSRDFQQAVRHGRRAARPTLVVHPLLPAESTAAAGAVPAEASSTGPARAGLVVSRRVGGSVVRHTVARRLRHVLAPRLELLPAGSHLVVRALPSAAAADSGSLAADLDAALGRCGVPRLRPPAPDGAGPA